VLAIVGLLATAFGTRAGAGRNVAAASLAAHLPGGGRMPVLFAALAAGGFGFYALLEGLEGHGLAGSPLALAVIVPLAAVIAIALRFVVGWIAGAGASLSGLTLRGTASAGNWFALAPLPAPIRLLEPLRGTRRGRAPPVRA
jgi:hypothetical protein